jgi:hypothetical protein
MHPFVRVFFVFWFGVVLLGGGAISVKTIATSLGNGSLPENLWLGVAIPFRMLAFAVALVTFGKYLSRDEPGFLIAFVRRILDVDET